MALLTSASRAVAAALLPLCHSPSLNFSCIFAAATNPNFRLALDASETKACPSHYSKRPLRTFAAMANEAREIAVNNPGLVEKPDEATKGYFMQQTMFRIKDPKVTLDFYSRVLGMKLLKRLDFPEMKFSLYFMGYEDTNAAPTDPVERTVWTFSQKATIELTQ